MIDEECGRRDGGYRMQLGWSEEGLKGWVGETHLLNLVGHFEQFGEVIQPEVQVTST